MIWAGPRYREWSACSSERAGKHLLYISSRCDRAGPIALAAGHTAREPRRARGIATCRRSVRFLKLASRQPHRGLDCAAT